MTDRTNDAGAAQPVLLRFKDENATGPPYPIHYDPARHLNLVDGGAERIACLEARFVPKSQLETGPGED